jgi:hypothetical protein
MAVNFGRLMDMMEFVATPITIGVTSCMFSICTIDIVSVATATLMKP